MNPTHLPTESPPPAYSGALEPPVGQGTSRPNLSVEAGHAYVDIEEAEFAKLVKRYTRNIAARALPRLARAGLEDNVDDVVQNVWFTASRRRVISLCDGDHVRIVNYLLQSTDNAVTNELRRDGAWRALLNRYKRYLRIIKRAPKTALQEMMQRELRSLVLRAVEGLSPRRREVFNRVCELHMSYAETAKSLNMSKKTVSAHMTIIHRVIRETLTAADYSRGPNGRGTGKEQTS